MPSEQEPPVPIRETGSGAFVFFSYAHQDKWLRDELEKHLSNLKYRGLITTWHDQDIQAGEQWAQQIDIYLSKAHIILLLISADFMASQYCYGSEMKRALERHQQREADVIPILLRPVLFTDAPFAKLQMLPTNRKPLMQWQNRDSAFVDIACGIERVAKRYLPHPHSYLLESGPTSHMTRSQFVKPGFIDIRYNTHGGRMVLLPPNSLLPSNSSKDMLPSDDESTGQTGMLKFTQPVKAMRVPLADNMKAHRSSQGDPLDENSLLPVYPSSHTQRTPSNAMRIIIKSFLSPLPIGIFVVGLITASLFALFFHSHVTVLAIIVCFSLLAASIATAIKAFRDLRTRSEDAPDLLPPLLLADGTSVMEEPLKGTGGLHILGELPAGTEIPMMSTEGGENVKKRLIRHFGEASEADQMYYEEAIEAYSRALLRNPSDEEALRGIGNALYALERYDEALNLFQQAIDQNPTPSAYAGLTNVFAKLKRNSEAVAAYEKAIELDPTVTFSYDDLIQSMLALGRREYVEQVRAEAKRFGYYKAILSGTSKILSAVKKASF